MDRLRSWFAAEGARFHPRVVLESLGPFGTSVLAPRIDEDTTIVACPFSLVITKDTALRELSCLLGQIDAWTERQLICSYLCFHHLCPALRHAPYVHALPAPETLLTPLYFTSAEREVLRGTNLYGATLDRERDWRAEWAQCRSLVQGVDPAWGDAFTWDMYLAASTHLSSRAFPSTVLSPNPSLSSPESYPVLIPGLDLLNHRRGQPVSWVVDDDTVSIVVHPKPGSDSDPDPDSTSAELIQVFNNYGAKPNDELILGYGFSLPDNPDDTITLQIRGSTTTTTSSSSSQKWVVGRNALNIDGLWSEIRGMVASGESDYPFEDDLETAAVLTDMVRAKLGGMKTVADVRQNGSIRPAVRVMVEHYISGQRDILESILGFANEKHDAAVESAREQGIDLVFDQDVDD